MGRTFVMVADIAEGAEQAFQQYEALVLPLLVRHGGRLERQMRTQDARTEVHIVSFASETGYRSYIADPERRTLRGVLANVDVVQRLLQVDDV